MKKILLLSFLALFAATTIAPSSLSNRFSWIGANKKTGLAAASGASLVAGLGLFISDKEFRKNIGSPKKLMALLKVRGWKGNWRLLAATVAIFSALGLGTAGWQQPSGTGCSLSDAVKEWQPIDVPADTKESGGDSLYGSGSSTDVDQFEKDLLTALNSNSPAKIKQLLASVKSYSQIACCFQKFETEYNSELEREITSFGLCKTGNGKIAYDILTGGTYHNGKTIFDLDGIQRDTSGFLSALFDHMKDLTYPYNASFMLPALKKIGDEGARELEEAVKQCIEIKKVIDRTHAKLRKCFGMSIDSSNYICFDDATAGKNTDAFMAIVAAEEYKSKPLLQKIARLFCLAPFWPDSITSPAYIMATLTDDKMSLEKKRAMMKLFVKSLCDATFYQEFNRRMDSLSFDKWLTNEADQDTNTKAYKLIIKYIQRYNNLNMPGWHKLNNLLSLSNSSSTADADHTDLGSAHTYHAVASAGGTELDNNAFIGHIEELNTQELNDYLTELINSGQALDYLFNKIQTASQRFLGHCSSSICTYRSLMEYRHNGETLFSVIAVSMKRLEATDAVQATCFAQLINNAGMPHQEINQASLYQNIQWIKSGTDDGKIILEVLEWNADAGKIVAEQLRELNSIENQSDSLKIINRILLNKDKDKHFHLKLMSCFLPLSDSKRYSAISSIIYGGFATSLLISSLRTNYTWFEAEINYANQEALRRGGYNSTFAPVACDSTESTETETDFLLPLTTLKAGAVSLTDWMPDCELKTKFTELITRQDS